jgi:hypothetical protein
MAKIPYLVAFVKGVGAVGLGGLILWQVAEHSGSARGTAIIHVSEAHVVVSLDDRDYPVNTLWELPLICELRPGSHVLRMKRGERVVFQEDFSIEPGQELVLTAWEAPSDSSAHVTPEELRAAGLPIPVNLSPQDRR